MASRAEGVVQVQRVLKFLFDAEFGVVKSVVQSSMRDKSYQVEVQ